MGFYKNTLRAGIRSMEAQGYSKRLSKVLENGNDYRFFFRKFYDEENGTNDLAFKTVVGRNLDLTMCGSTFIVYNEDMYTTNAAGKNEDKTKLDVWARISRVIYDASCAREKRLVEMEASQTAADLGVGIDQEKLKNDLARIEMKYYGGVNPDGTKARATANRAISDLTLVLTCQLLVVKLKENGAPDLQNATTAVAELSLGKAIELQSICDNPVFCDNDSEFLEVFYSYRGGSKGEAGLKAKFVGVEKDSRLSAKFPEEWKNYSKSKLSLVVKGSDPDETGELMRAKNRNLCSTTTIEDVVSGLRKWASSNAAVFAAIDMEKNSTKYTAEALLESKLLDSVPAIKSKIEKVAEEFRKSRGTISAAEAEKELEEINKAEQAVANIETNASTVKGIVDDVIKSGIDISDLGDIDELE